MIGYDKDNDVFVPFGTYDEESKALKKAQDLLQFLKAGSLVREFADGSREPLDWLEVYKDWNKDDEQIIWGSYEYERSERA